MSESAANPPIRLISRKMTQTVFDTILDWKPVFGRNLNHGSVALAVWLANAEFALKDPEMIRAWRRDGVPFDRLKPIIPSHVATASDFDAETSRRHLIHLVEAGVLYRSEDGFTVSPAFLQSEECDRLVALSTRRILEFFRYLDQFGTVREHLRSLNGQYNFLEIDDIEPKLHEIRHIAHLLFMRLFSKFSIERYIVLDNSKMLSFIGMGVFVENVRDCNVDPVMSLQYGAFEPPLPASLKTPVSMRRLATVLDTPLESVRRYVNQLELTGYLAKTDKGYLVPGENLMLYDTMVSQSAAVARLGAEVTQALADLDAAT